MSLTSMSALSCRCAPSLQVVMMSGPAPLSTAAAVLVGRSVWLMNSKATSTPFSLVYCLACSRRVSSMAFRVFDQVRILRLAAPCPLRMNVPKDRAAVAPAVTPRNFRRLIACPASLDTVFRCRMTFSPSRLGFTPWRYPCRQVPGRRPGAASHIRPATPRWSRTASDTHRITPDRSRNRRKPEAPAGWEAPCSATAGAPDAITSPSTSTAFSPIPTGSCSTTVRGGVIAAADRKSSKPIRATSSGQRSPRSWMASNAASAIRLLNAKMARGRGVSSRHSAAAL